MKSFFQILAFSLLATVSYSDDFDQHAKAIEAPVPTYPPPGPGEADKGVVSVVFAVDDSGDAKVGRIMGSSSYRFEDSVRLIAPRWKFAPGKIQGKSVADVLGFIFFFSPGKEVEIVGPLYES